MQCESRSVRTVTTKYTDSEGNVKSRRRAELSGKSVLYEGEYSETDSEAEGDPKSKSSSSNKIAGAGGGKTLIKNLGGLSLGAGAEGGGPLRIGIDSIRLLGGGTFHKPNQTPQDANMMKRQKVLTQIPNIELKPVKVTEFNENIDENSDSDEYVFSYFYIISIIGLMFIDTKPKIFALFTLIYIPNRLINLNLRNLKAQSYVK